MDRRDFIGTAAMAAGGFLLSSAGYLGLGRWD